MMRMVTMEPMEASARRVVVPLVVGLLGAVGVIIGYLVVKDREIFFRAYLFAWLICLGISLGGNCLVMLHNQTGGAWGDGPRRVGEAAGCTLPLVAVLFVPVLFGLPVLYPWARSDALANATLRHRQIYFSYPFFFARAIIYFALWIFLAFMLRYLHRKWLRTGDIPVRSRLRGWSAAGLILYLLSMTHAGVDWIMSRDTEFYSTTFGFILTVGQTLAALSFAIIVGAMFPRTFPARQPRTERGIFNDVGNVLLTLVILWTYVSFMQLLVIWMGNTREDNTWYIQRGLGQENPWRWIGLALVVFHFFIPFYVLLFRAAKQYRPALAALAWLLLISYVVEAYWLVAPTGRDGPVFNLHWVDAAAVLAVGGIWVAAFFWMFERLPRETLISEAPEPMLPEGAPMHV